ncbi:MAG: redoxin family protein [Planctomycetota bacterium]
MFARCSMFLRSAALVAMVCATSLVGAQTEEGAAGEAKRKIGIGDNAPALQVGEWIQGEPVAQFEKGKVYVLDFWATWCGPCIAAMPHMTETQEKYKDKGVQVVGVAIWQPDFADVKPWVEKNQKKMGYSVVLEHCPPHPEGMTEPRDRFQWSSEKGKMSQTWMKAAERNGIPSVFIVDQNQKIAWVGHPMDGMDEALDKIVSGKYDLAEAAKKQRQAEQAEELKERFVAMMRAGKHSEAFKFAAGHVDTTFNEDANFLNFIAWGIVDPEGNVKDKDLALAMRAAVRANDLTKGKNAAIVDTLARVHFCKGELTRAIALQEKAVELAEGEMKEELAKALAEYQAKAAEEKPEKESF